MNPITWFKDLKPAVKITLIICLTLLLTVFMYFAYEAGVFDVIVRGIFDEAKS